MIDQKGQGQKTQRYRYCWLLHLHNHRVNAVHAFFTLVKNYKSYERYVKCTGVGR